MAEAVAMAAVRGESLVTVALRGSLWNPASPMRAWPFGFLLFGFWVFFAPVLTPDGDVTGSRSPPVHRSSKEQNKTVGVQQKK